MIRTQVLLTETQYELAKRHATMKGISMSALVRKALDKVFLIKKEEPPAAVLSRMAKNATNLGPPDLSTNDNYLYGNKDL